MDQSLQHRVVRRKGMESKELYTHEAILFDDRRVYILPIINNAADSPLSLEQEVIKHLWEKLKALAALAPETNQPGSYKLLGNGQIIRSSDEHLDDNCTTWLAIDKSFVGRKYNVSVMMPIRRKVEP
jgi:hypothetical protein